MRPGTPGFVGARLAQARQVRQITAVALSEMIGVSPATISYYETSARTPAPATFERIVNTMGFPAQFFMTRVRSLERSSIFYRSMSSATKGARVRAEHRFSWLREIVHYISDAGIELPPSSLPEFDLPNDWRQLSMDDIEHLAAEARAHFRLPRGAIADVVRVLEHHGVVVARDMLGADTLDSLSEVADGRCFIAIGTDKGTAVRWRFDTAHELGHGLLHRGVQPSALNKGADFKLLESQAHRFAAAFLLPLDSFGDDLTGVSLDALRAMKPKWKVSIGMMIRRLYDCELVDARTYRSLLINHSRRGWKRREPYDDDLPAEEPRLLAQALTMLFEQGIPRAQLLADLALPALDIETIAGLPAGTLQDDPGPLNDRRDHPAHGSRLRLV